MFIETEKKDAKERLLWTAIKDFDNRHNQQAIDWNHYKREFKGALTEPSLARLTEPDINRFSREFDSYVDWVGKEYQGQEAASDEKREIRIKMISRKLNSELSELMKTVKVPENRKVSYKEMHGQKGWDVASLSATQVAAGAYSGILAVWAIANFVSWDKYSGFVQWLWTYWIWKTLDDKLLWREMEKLDEHLREMSENFEIEKRFFNMFNMPDEDLIAWNENLAHDFVVNWINWGKLHEINAPLWSIEDIKSFIKPEYLNKVWRISDARMLEIFTLLFVDWKIRSLGDYGSFYKYIDTKYVDSLQRVIVNATNKS